MPLHRILPANDKQTLADDLSALNNLTFSELKAEWRRIYRCPPPRLSRDLLQRAITFRLQEKKQGGLDKTCLQLLESDGEHQARDVAKGARPGTRLVREWNGRTYTVTVTENGFDYDGQSYQSLSRVARKITGARWSGPRFFGLKSKRRANLGTING